MNFWNNTATQRKGNRGWKPVAFVLCLILLAHPGDQSAAARTRQNLESVKSAFLINFTRYTEWPASTWNDVEEKTLSIGIMGDEKLFTTLLGLHGQREGRYILDIRRIDNPSDTTELHVLFLAGNDRELWLAVRTAIGEHSILTIGEMNGFLDTNGVINFVTEDNRFRFDVNLVQARHVGLKVSSRLLRLARKVKK